MGDDEVITALRHSFTAVHSATPLERIVSHSRAVRVRRRVPGAAAAVGTAAAVAVGLGLGLPASQTAATHTARGPTVRLAAWTVTEEANGTIQVTFNEATDPAGLQGALRADGVPASVTFTGQQNPACQPYPSTGGFGGPRPRVLQWPPDAAQSFTTPYAMVIKPSALPSGAGLQIWTSGTPGAADNFQLHADLVQASPQCTGS
jgi:hypothetical protein